MAKTVIAICYDFDKTLAKANMQEFSFIPNLNISTAEFWTRANKFAQKNQCDITLAYLRTMIDECEKAGIALTHEYLKSLGKDIEFFDGVKTWFARLNRFAEKQGVKLEHYLISSGNLEIIEGTPIFKEFTKAFGCEFLYNSSGLAYWPKNTVNYTLKTQYLFRICKNANDITDEHTVNKRIPKKHVEFRNMIYVGDGLTDIPCMTLVKERGGVAISVYHNNDRQQVASLVEDNRVNYICKSNYKSGSPFEKLVKMIISSLALKETLLQKECKTTKK